LASLLAPVLCPDKSNVNFKFTYLVSLCYDEFMFSWRVRRQLIVLFLAVLPLIAIGFWLVPKLLPAPTCFDGRKNQGELEVDCGGPCISCELRHPQALHIFWARATRAREGLYDAAALVENPNEEIGASKLEYEFTFFDELGLVARQTGKTFILPGERVHLIEPSIATNRLPNRVEFRILNVQWQKTALDRPRLVVERRDYKVLTDKGRRQSAVEAVIINRSPFGLREAWVNFTLLDKEGNVLGLNQILVENLLSGSRKPIRAIWPEEFKGEVASIEVEPRVNTFDPSVILKP